MSFCTLLQHFLGLNDSMSTLSSTKSSPICLIRQWFGVKMRSPLGSSLTAVKGLKFCRLSTPMKILLDALAKFIPSSHSICYGHPLQAVILTRNPSVSKDDTISKWEQWVLKHGNKHKYCLAPTFPRLYWVKKGSFDLNCTALERSGELLQSNLR